MLLLAEGLFRVDVIVLGDSLKTIVRDLAGQGVEIRGPAGGGPQGESFVFGGGAAYQPGRAQLEFTLGGRRDRLEVRVTIATMRLAQRGTIKVTAQAIARQAAGL